MSKTPEKQKGDPDTTGHSWDGIEEFNNPLPKWWLYCLYACIAWGVVYTVLYPAWPGINKATPGILGFSTRAEVAKDIQAVDQSNAAINAKLVETDLTAIADDQELTVYARQAGAAVFRTWCAQCHGSGANGATAGGYPSLLDDDWLWGGDIEAIHETISYGIRNEENDNARYSEMPAYGRDELLEKEQISQVVNYVMSLSGTPQDASQVEAGAEIFANECTACHAEDGTGDRFQGAPNLTDAIWLYGGDFATLTDTVTNARFGVMPAWEERLSEAEIRAVSTYVHGLGGGEATEE